MNIIIFSGAGLSAESGIQTFRSADGLWNGHAVEEVATPEGFRRNPALVHEFYNARRRELLNVEPNPAHIAIAKLQNALPEYSKDHNRRVTVITQNIDDLLERAGCAEVLHIHGELLRCRCLYCNEEIKWTTDTSTTLACPLCKRGGNQTGMGEGYGALRPAVVWFNEIPQHLERVEEELSDCDIFVSIGTSGVVYPAAGFSRVAKHHGAKTICFNLDTPDNKGDFDEFITGEAGKTFPEWLNAQGW